MESELYSKAKKINISIICIKELNIKKNVILKKVLSNDFIECCSPDTTYVYTGRINGLSYKDNMRSKYRNVLEKRKKEFDQLNLTWKVVIDFSDYIQEIYNMYLNVWKKSNIKFEKLTPEFFAEINSELQRSVYVLMCFYQDKPIAFELFLEGNNLHPIYLGIDYTYRDIGSLYFNCLYRIIEEAEKKGYQIIELGQTSYDVKSSIGAVSSNLFFYLRHTNKLVNKLLKLFTHILFPKSKIVPIRNVFKLQKEYLNLLKLHGFYNVD